MRHNTAVTESPDETQIKALYIYKSVTDHDKQARSSQNVIITSKLYARFININLKKHA